MRVSKKAKAKYGNGTTYTVKGKKVKRKSEPGTKKADAYCARSAKQKQTEKVRVRRSDWKCKGNKSKK